MTIYSFLRILLESFLNCINTKAEREAYSCKALSSHK